MTGETAQMSSASMTTPSRAVFLSYASEDAPAAQRIADALRAAGIDVWFDQSELRGGDVWDQKIRHEIHDCALFIPIVSQHTQERLEGYFRHEWKLAIERTHHMAEQKAFLVPVVVDGTRDQEALVPDAFRDVQWTRLPAGETPPEFVARIQKLLSGESGPLPTIARTSAAETSRRSLGLKSARLAVTLVLAAVTAYLLVEKPWIAKPVAFAPPPHSIAVLPFVNMSGDKEQEYFSEGLTEELLNSISRIDQLQVAARTSSFSFQGEHLDIATVAHKLNVGAVLEGSVRRAGNTVRITTQLVNAITGFHLWSQTYDRDLGDVLKLQTEIATAVADALKVTLLGDIAQKIELGGTRNPAAFDAYLRGQKAFRDAHNDKDEEPVVAAYTEAIGLDPDYALAFANRSIALANRAQFASGAEIRESFLDQARADAMKAIALAPELAEGHMALGSYFALSLDFARAIEAYKRAAALAPGDARVVRNYGVTASLMGLTEAAISATRRAVVLDPLNPWGYFDLGITLGNTRQYKEAIAAYQNALALDPENPDAVAGLGLDYYALGDFESARALCERKPDDSAGQWCLAVTYEKLGRHTDANNMLAKLKAQMGDAAAYQYATIYAQWSDVPKALEWLDTALRVRDSGLQSLKTDPLVDPLRKEPRFQAIERELKFPD